MVIRNNDALIGFRTQLEHGEKDTANLVPSGVRAFLNLSDVAFVQVCDEVVHCVDPSYAPHDRH